jgi:hypothetical protein
MMKASLTLILSALIAPAQAVTIIEYNLGPGWTYSFDPSTTAIDEVPSGVRVDFNIPSATEGGLGASRHALPDLSFATDGFLELHYSDFSSNSVGVDVYIALEVEFLDTNNAFYELAIALFQNEEGVGFESWLQTEEAQCPACGESATDSPVNVNAVDGILGIEWYSGSALVYFIDSQGEKTYPLAPWDISGIIGAESFAVDNDFEAITGIGESVVASIIFEHVQFGAVDSAPELAGITGLPDISGNGIPEIGITMPGSTHVHIRDGSTDALISDINFGNDDALQMVVLPDLDASGNPEIAMLNEQDSGQVRVQIRDSVTGGIVSNLWYGMQYEPVSMAVVPDYSGNGDPEIAVLGSESGTDAVRVQLRDSASNTFLDNVFLGTQSIAKDVVSLTDTSGNGIPEMGILGVLKANDQVRMQIWDTDTSAFQSNVWFAKVYQPHSTIAMPDINSNGSDEIVAMGVDPATQNIRVQVRDSDTTDTLFNIWLGNVNEAVDIALINDINSDGVADLAVLLKTPAGVGRVRVQSGSDGAFIRNLFYSVVENPVGLAVMPDYSGNGFDELAVLGEIIAPDTGAPLIHVQILDTSTGGQVNRIDFP